MKTKYDPYVLEYIFTQCRDNQLDDILEIKSYPQVNYGLRGACLTGNKELALLMISRGADDYDKAICDTYYKGYKEITLLLIEKWFISDPSDFGNEFDITKCNILEFDDIYYLYLRRINVGKYKKQCKLYKETYEKILSEIIQITDVVNFMIEF